MALIILLQLTIIEYILFVLQGFFEEIEDMKYALQQSARLNKEYEKLLRRLCNQFGLPYPYT